MHSYDVPFWAGKRPCRSPTGAELDFCLFRHLKHIIDLDPKIADGALKISYVPAAVGPRRFFVRR